MQVPEGREQILGLIQICRLKLKIRSRIKEETQLIVHLQMIVTLDFLKKKSKKAFVGPQSKIWHRLNKLEFQSSTSITPTLISLTKPPLKTHK